MRLTPLQLNRWLSSALPRLARAGAIGPPLAGPVDDQTLVQPPFMAGCALAAAASVVHIGSSSATTRCADDQIIHELCCRGAGGAGATSAAARAGAQGVSSSSSSTFFTYRRMVSRYEYIRIIHTLYVSHEGSLARITGRKLNIYG